MIDKESKRIAEKFKVITNRRARLITVNWDARAKEDIATKKGFRITEDGKTDSDQEPGMYSIHSPLYGTDYNSEFAYEDRYSCECGNFIGKSYLGRKCQLCDKTVTFVDIDMTVTGWIILDRDRIINSIYFKKIKSFIGPKVFPNIIKFKEIEDREPTATNPFDGIGIIELQERFSEIMEFYLKKHGSNPKKRDMYLFIMSHPNEIFAHAIPVYSSHLRPFVIRAEEVKYTKDDKCYRRIYTNSKLLNDRFELERRIEVAKKNTRSKRRTAEYLRRENILFAVQTDLDRLWDLSFETIKKKTGVIRDQVLGGRMHFTARNVIVPSKYLKPNEIELGYTTFLELYKLEIISILTNMYGIPQSRAWSMWDAATIVFDEQIYKIMEYMVENREVWCEINRNPTINYGSQLVMRIVHVSPDITDHCLVLPELVLTVFNADFDGDVLNIVSLKIDSIRNEYRDGLDPMKNIFISRNDGKYNLDASLFKDQVIGLYCFANM